MGRICKYCEKAFQPSGKAGKLCEECKNKSEIFRRTRVFTFIRLNRLLLKIDKKIEQGASS